MTVDVSMSTIPQALKPDNRSRRSSELSLPEFLPPCFDEVPEVNPDICSTCGMHIKRSSFSKIKGILRRSSSKSTSDSSHSTQLSLESTSVLCSRCINEAEKISERQQRLLKRLNGDVPSCPLNQDSCDVRISSYKGPFNAQGLPHGSDGVMKWTNGDVYEGNFVNGARNGEGWLHFADGSYYFGDWADNLMHGCGTRRFPNGNTYRGSYKRGKRDGKEGHFEFVNGNVYEGEFEDDMFHGQGIFTYKNGVTYQGGFCKGKRQGNGAYLKPDKYTDHTWYSQDEPVGAGVRWKHDGSLAWRLIDGKVSKEPIDFEDGIKTMEDLAKRERLSRINK